MTDLEMTKLCAEAMGYFRPQDSQHVGPDFNGVWCSQAEHDPDDNKGVVLFHPLHDDAQAMALLKRFPIAVSVVRGGSVMAACDATCKWTEYPDLNRAIVECVAKMQASK